MASRQATKRVEEAIVVVVVAGGRMEKVEVCAGEESANDVLQNSESRSLSSQGKGTKLEDMSIMSSG